VYILKSFTLNFSLIQGYVESNNNTNKINTKLIQKSQHLHKVHKYLVFYITQYKTKSQSLESEL